MELSAGRGLDKAQHCLREGWRLWCWDRFVQTGRHELAFLGRIDPASILRKDWKSIRRLIATNAPARTVALGASVTPAWFQHDVSGSFSTSCMWCDELGTHDHIFWRCPHSPLLGCRPAVRGDGLCRRFGWQGSGTAALEYMSKVQARIWDFRWSRAH